MKRRRECEVIPYGWSWNIWLPHRWRLLGVPQGWVNLCAFALFHRRTIRGWDGFCYDMIRVWRWRLWPAPAYWKHTDLTAPEAW